MTRAGEKLYGDWERRISQNARPIRWRSVLLDAFLLLLALLVGGLALFGFG